MKRTPLITFLVILIIAINSSACGGADTAFSPKPYVVRVEDRSTSRGIYNAKVIIEATGIGKISDVTDSDGYVRLSISSSYVGKPGRLIIEVDGYQAYRSEINLDVERLPTRILLTPLPFVATDTPIPTPFPTSLAKDQYTPTSSTMPTGMPLTLAPTNGLAQTSSNLLVVSPSGFWISEECSGTLKNTGNLINISLPLQNLSNLDCFLKHESSQPEISRVSITTFLTKGIGEKSWIGMVTSCGGEWINFMLSPSVVAVDGYGVSKRTIIEELTNTIPVTRTLVAEWTGANLRLVLIDPSTDKISSEKILSCNEPPNWLHIGAITNPGGYIEGEIRNIEIEFR